MLPGAPPAGMLIPGIMPGIIIPGIIPGMEALGFSGVQTLAVAFGSRPCSMSHCNNSRLPL